MATKRSKHKYRESGGLSRPVKDFLLSLLPFRPKTQDKGFTITRRRLFGSVANMDQEETSNFERRTPSSEDSHARTPDHDMSDDEDTTPKAEDQPSFTPRVRGKRVGFADLPLRSYIDKPDTIPLLASQRDAIDEDFDFSGRKHKVPSKRKLHKRASHSSMHKRSLSVASSQQAGNTPSRSSSVASSSSTRSFSGRFSNLFNPSRRVSTTKPPTGPNEVFPDFPLPPIPAQLPSTSPDDLPSDKPALESRINYHLSQLGHLKRDLHADNSRIRTLIRDQKLWKHSSLATQMPAVTTHLLEQRLLIARNARNSLRPVVEWHRGELEAIARKRIAMDHEIGLEARLPQVYAGLDNDYEWNSLFLV